MFEIFEHTADLGIRVVAPDRDTLFADAGRGLFSVIVANLDQVRPVQEVAFHLEGGQVDYLLFDWLNELLYTFESRRLVLAEFGYAIEEFGKRRDGLNHCRLFWPRWTSEMILPLARAPHAAVVNRQCRGRKTGRASSRSPPAIFVRNPAASSSILFATATRR